MSVAVVIVAAGAGNRLGCAVPKAFVVLAGRPLLAHALAGALAAPSVSSVVVVAPAAEVATARALVPDGAPVTVVAGGAERTDSVRAGLAALAPDVELVLVHDAARCLAPPALFESVVAALRDGADAVVPGLAVVDTIKQVDDDGHVVATPARAALRAVQTPQGFRRELLAAAHASPAALAVTDDAGLVESLGHRVLVVEGDARARKVTLPEDLAALELLLAQ